MDLLTENIGTIIVGAAVLAVLALVIFKIVRDKKQGKSSCGCQCSHCQNAAFCHGKSMHSRNE
ncbi:MAG: FeoB-associated Cys-rich membrane protein [Oscillospiraceae bacterium]|nr:FeoB-associated Cys-rich membrane protein [Oscillospiraceae bacterium]